MTNQKKIFLALSTAFLILLFLASYDIARRTTFPGSKGQLKERIRENFLEKDSTLIDTTRIH